MAKKSVVERNKKRQRLVEKYAEKRQECKAIIKAANTSDEEFYAAQAKLAKLPRNGAPVRLRNRCSITGRARGYYRKFGLSRIAFRELASSGEIPGITKSSW